MPPKKKWSRETIIREIKMIYARGDRLDLTNARKNFRSLVWASCKYFGSWKEGIRACELDYSKISLIKVPEPRTKESVIEKIKKMSMVGENLNSNFVQLKRQALYGAAVRIFGSWETAITSSGLDYSVIRKQRPFRRWGRNTVVKEIISRKKRRLPISGGYVSKTDRGLYQAARRNFGKKGWQEALRLSGFDPRMENPRVIWTKERIISKINELKQINFPLNIYSMIRNNYFGLVNAGRKYFGSWRKAIEAAGIDYNEIIALRMNYWNRENVIKEIKKLEKEGCGLSSKSVQKIRGDLFSAALARFGSWSHAVETAGFNYNFHCKNFSYKAWLRKLKPEQLEKIKKQSLEFSKGGKVNGKKN